MSIDVVPGLAVVTYKRPTFLRDCLGFIAKYTTEKHQLVVVSDSNDDPETVDVCRDMGVALISGVNRGVVWNKNRALYYFMSRTKCDPIILLEDDAFPMEDGWLTQWVEATSRWQHVNFSHPGLFANGRDPYRGDGTPDDPHVHPLLTGQCTSVSRSAIYEAGYLDPRFRGYGHGHVEWTTRHGVLVYKKLLPGNLPGTPYLSIKGGVRAVPSPSFKNDEDIARNGELMKNILASGLRPVLPWRSQEEKEQLELELDGMTGLVESGTSRPPSNFKGYVDSVAADLAGRLVLRGWAVDQDGRPPSELAVSINGNSLPVVDIRREPRDDVAKVVPGADRHSGFRIVVGLPPEYQRVWLSGTYALEVSPVGASGPAPSLRLPSTVANSRADTRLDVVNSSMSPGELENKPAVTTAEAVSRIPKGTLLRPKVRGFVDVIYIGPSTRLTLRGWAADQHGKPASKFEVLLDGQLQPIIDLKRVIRPDVAKVVSGSTGTLGFEVTIGLPDRDSIVPSSSRIKLIAVAADGHSRSLPVPSSVEDRVSASPVPDMPHMPDVERAHFLAALDSAHCYLEYGSGGSTVAALRRKLPVVSVESDRAWHDLVLQETKSFASTSSQLLHVDVGPTGAWGTPASEIMWRQYSEYAVQPWQVCRQYKYSPDLVLIDGRFRVACFLSSLIFGAPGTRILFDDYIDRKCYHVAESFLARARTAGRLAEFIVPETVPREEIWLALLRYVGDSR